MPTLSSRSRGRRARLLFHRGTFPMRFCRLIGALGLQPGQPRRLEPVRLPTIASHVNASPSSVHPVEHLHSALYVELPLVTSSTVLSGSYHSSSSFSPYSPFSSHHSPRVMPRRALRGAHLLEPRPLNDDDGPGPLLGARAPDRAPGRVEGAGATRLTAITAIARTNHKPRSARRSRVACSWRGVTRRGADLEQQNLTSGEGRPENDFTVPGCPRLTEGRDREPGGASARIDNRRDIAQLRIGGGEHAFDSAPSARAPPPSQPRAGD